jgi:hypothetical protein
MLTSEKIHKGKNLKKIFFGNLQMSLKSYNNFFNFVYACTQHALKQNFRRKNLTIKTKTIKNIIIFCSVSKLHPIEALWCKTNENPSDRKSHTLAPLNKTN